MVLNTLHEKMNPRKKFKPRNSNSNIENEIPSVYEHIDSVVSCRDTKSSPASSSASNSGSEKHKLSPKHWNSSPKHQYNNGQYCGPVKRQLNYNNPPVLFDQQRQSHNPKSYNNKQGKRLRSPKKDNVSPVPNPKTAADFASPKSFNSPNAAEVPLPPVHWFPATPCSREMLLEQGNISAQLKSLLNVA